MPNDLVTLVLGGARSGKSAYAEGLLASHPDPVYIATGQAFDAEMRERIEAHRRRRPAHWATREIPLELPAALASEAAVLVDCLTLWVSNLLFAGHDIAAAAGALEHSLHARTHPTILVASETGLGIVPGDALSRRFRDEAGLLNQRIASVAGTVLFVAAGLPLALKGRVVGARRPEPT